MAHWLSFLPKDDLGNLLPHPNLPRVSGDE